jgi:hypothetical protein
MEPASIRYKNPGAMWGNALATKWGALDTVTLHDGLGQGNNIAVFPTYVQGICAQLDLWRTSPNYKNKRFADAIAIWSGRNYVESYIAYVLDRVPGMTRDTVMNDEFWKSSMGIAFLKAQAGHEAGKPYPAPDADWVEAQRRVFGGFVTTGIPSPAPMSKPVEAPAPKPAPVATPKKAAVIVATTVAAGTAAHQSGASINTVAIVVIVACVLAVIGFVIYSKGKS